MKIVTYKTKAEALIDLKLIDDEIIITADNLLHNRTPETRRVAAEEFKYQMALANRRKSIINSNFTLQIIHA